MAWFKILLAAPVSYGTIAALGLVPNAAIPTAAPSNAAANTALVGMLPLDDDGPGAKGVTQRHDLHRAADGLFYVTALVNGTPVRFLFDTGANMVVLTRDDALRVGVGAGSSNGAADGSDTMETAGGAAQIDRVMLSHIDVAGRRVGNVDAAVANRGLKVSLLGQNLLSRLGPLTLAGDTIVIDRPKRAPVGGAAR